MRDIHILVPDAHEPQARVEALPVLADPALGGVDKRGPGVGHEDAAYREEKPTPPLPRPLGGDGLLFSEGADIQEAALAVCQLRHEPHVRQESADD